MEAKKPKAAAAAADQIWTPEKPKTSPPASAADQIWTPEKPAQLPRRARNRSVAFSVKEVRRAALELRRAEKGPAAAAEVAAEGQEDELGSVERQLGVGAAAGTSSSPAKPKAQIKLPDKYEMLCEFFNCMESSIRLLRMKGSMTTFPNICTSIQHLSERRFTYSHLAQLKYILPEAIVVKKILLREERTCCMRPDLQVTLLVDAIGSNAKKKGETGYSVLRRIFRQRLVDFVRDNSEIKDGDDIPEDELPHPFNQTKPTMLPTTPKVVTTPTAAVSSSNLSQQQPIVLSHMSHSFQRRFSQKARICGSDQAVTSTSSALAKDVSAVSSLVESAPKPPVHRKPLVSSPISCSSYMNAETPVQEAKMSEKDGNYLVPGFDVSEGTPAKFASTPIRLMANTPDLQTPKRPLSDTGYDTTPKKKVTKRSARTKLFTTPTKSTRSTEEESQSRSLSVNDGDDDVLSFLPKSLLQSVKEKEKRALEEKEVGFADRVKRQKLIACLPSTFDVILLIYQSRQRSVMTKQELIHKIIASNPKVVDRVEVEEQLKLFLELIPDWISEKTARSGDILCCINMISTPAEIRQRLYKAE